MLQRLVQYQCIVFVLAIALAPVQLLADDEIEVRVSISRDTIGLDEHAILEVELIGESQNLPDPKIPTISAFEIYSQGRSSNISIVNGQVSASVTYRYMLLPSQAGTFPISRIAAVYNNRRYEGNSVEITVLNTGTATSPTLEDNAVDSQGKRRDYFMEAVVDNAHPYVNEQVTLTLKIYFAVQIYGSPELSEPTTTGFWTEVLGNKAPYYQKISGRNYKVIERMYALFPTQTGKLTVGRATITATVAGRSRQRDPLDLFSMFNRGEEVTMHSQPIEVDVQALPTEGRPKDFTGTIGKFKISASASRNRVEVNQPVSVTYRISGVGNIKSVAEPEFPDLNDFRVYRASSSENISKLENKVGGTKIFEEVFIPNRPGRLTIPAISFNYFDPEKKRYETVQTREIALQVEAAEGYEAGVEVPYGAPSTTIGSGASDIRYIKRELGELRPIGRVILVSSTYVLVNAVPVLFMVGAVAYRRRRKKLAADVSYARSRAASRMARKRLTRAKSHASIKTSGDFYAELSLALMSYVADKLNISPHGLTSEQLAVLLRERSADEQLIDDTVEFLHECDFARFASADTTQDRVDQTLRKAEMLIVKIEGIRFV